MKTLFGIIHYVISQNVFKKLIFLAPNTDRYLHFPTALTDYSLH